MSLPLPDGWVDTGVRKSYSWDCDLQVASVGQATQISGSNAGGVLYPDGLGNLFAPNGEGFLYSPCVVVNGISLATWCSVGGSRWPGPPPSYATDVSTLATTFDPGTAVGGVRVIGQISYTSDVDVISGVLWDPIHFTETGGPYRLGMSYRQKAYGSPVVPAYLQQDWEVVYAWFGDADTTVTQTLDGHSVSTSPYGSPAEMGPIVGELSINMPGGSRGTGNWGYGVGMTGGVWVRVTNIKHNGSDQDLSGLAPRSFTNIDLTDDAGGFVLKWTNLDAFGGWWTGYGITIGDGYQAVLAVDVTRDGAAVVTGCLISDPFLCSQVLNGDGVERLPYQASIGNPGNVSIVVPQRSWEQETGHEVYKAVGPNGLQIGPLTLDSGWVDAQSPKLDQVTYDPAGDGTTLETVYDDLSLPIQAAPCAMDPRTEVGLDRVLSLGIGGWGALALSGVHGGTPQRALSGVGGVTVSGTLSMTPASPQTNPPTAAVTGSLTITLAQGDGLSVSGSIGGSVSGTLTGGTGLALTWTPSTAGLSLPDADWPVGVTTITFDGSAQVEITGSAVVGDMGLGISGSIVATATLQDSGEIDVAVTGSLSITGSGAVSGGVSGGITAGSFSAGVSGYTNSSPGGTVSGSLAGSGSFTMGGCPAFDRRLRLEIPARLEVNRPDGNTPSEWVTSDGSKLTVTENSTTSVFTVTATGATVTRTLATNWANYTDLSLNSDPSLSNPDMLPTGIQSYAITRHNRKDWVPAQHQQNYPEDVWWWNTYGFLRVQIDAPAAGTLTLVAQYTTFSVSDPHVTGSDEVYGTGFSESSGTATYSFAVASGSNEVYVDLQFPQEGGPVRLGRISSLELSGFATGTYTLRSLALTVRPAENGYLPVYAGYFKDGWGTAIRRASAPDHPLNPSRSPDWSKPVLALNGSDAFGDIPDQANKPGEVGAYGGGVRYCDPITGSETGYILDGQWSTQNYWQHCQDVEGFNAIWDQAAFDTGNKDAQGNSGSTGLAQAMWEVLPFRNLLYDPARGVYGLGLRSGSVCSQVTIPAGVQILVSSEHALFGRLIAEPTLMGTNRRVPENTPVDLIDASTGDIVENGHVDADGVVIWRDVFANSDAQYQATG